MSWLIRLALRKWRVSTVDVQDTHILSAADDSPQPPRTEWNLDNPEEAREWAHARAPEPETVTRLKPPSWEDDPQGAYLRSYYGESEGT